jgi:GTP-binding protein EngB required for normal cell division
MPVTSIDSYKNDIPGPRHLVGHWQKTIIIVSGISNVGKSQLCQLLVNDNIYYLSADTASFAVGHTIDILEKYIQTNIEYLDAGVYAHYINDNCPEEFMNKFFDRFVKNNPNYNIMIDGYLFILQPLHDFFVRKCIANNYRIWEMKRILKEGQI